MVLVDGAQAAPHLVIDVQDLDCDFYVLSSHKMFGPTGIGVLYGRKRLLEAMPPYQGGGDMIASVTFEKTLYNQVPYKFEAGHAEHRRRRRASARRSTTCRRSIARPRWRTKTTCSPTRPRRCARFPACASSAKRAQKTGVLSFVLDGAHPHDAGTILDQQGIAVRTGQHCAQPVMDRSASRPPSARRSAIYNTREDIDALVRGLHKVREVLRRHARCPELNRPLPGSDPRSQPAAA